MTSRKTKRVAEETSRIEPENTNMDNSESVIVSEPNAAMSKQDIRVASSFTVRDTYVVDTASYDELFTKSRDTNFKQRDIEDIVAAADLHSGFSAQTLRSILTVQSNIDITARPTEMSALATFWAMNRKDMLQKINEDSVIQFEVGTKTVSVFVPRGKRYNRLDPTLFTTNDMDFLAAQTLNNIVASSLANKKVLPMSGLSRVLASDDNLMFLADNYFVDSRTGSASLSTVVRNANLAGTRIPFVASNLDFYSGELQVALSTVSVYKTKKEVTTETLSILTKRIQKIIKRSPAFDEDLCKRMTVDLVEMSGGAADKATRIIQEIMNRRNPINNNVMYMGGRRGNSVVSFA